MSYSLNGQEITYSIEENGYTIYLGGNPWIDQHEPYIPNKNVSYEENAIAQIEDILSGHEEAVDIEALKADVDALKEEQIITEQYITDLDLQDIETQQALTDMDLRLMSLE